MKRELRDEWVVALRSGEYQQAQGTLREQVFDAQYEPTGKLRYCCLGVLADRLCKREPDVYRWSEDCTSEVIVTEDEMVTTCVDGDLGAIADLIGLPHAVQTPLVHANDGCGDWDHNPQSFERIADMIEEKVPVED